MKTRAEHLQWCKDTAMRYVESGKLLEAVTSMASDLDKHPETYGDGEALTGLFLLAALAAQRGDRDEVVRYIEGFR